MKRIITVKSARFFLGVLLACLSLAVSLFVYQNAKAGAVFALLFILSGAITIPRDLIPGKWIAAVYAVWFVVTALCVTFFSQLAMNELLPEYAFSACMEMLLIAIVMLVPSVITLRPRASAAVVSGLLFVFSCINYFVFLFRGSEIAPADLLSIGTAGNVAAEYSFVIPSFMFYALTLGVIYFFASFALPALCVEFRGKTRIRGAILIVVCSLALVFGSNYIRPLHWLQTGSVANGYLLNFTVLFREGFVREPAGYDADQVEGLANTYHKAEQEAEHTPDIIVVMDESFADFRVLGENFHTDVEVTPFLDGLKENTIRGYALSSVFGGGTPNSEYEFLSGNSMAYLPVGAIVYQQYIKGPVYSVATELKEKNYSAVALHPYQSNSWLRNTIWPYLGFEGTYFLDDFPQIQYLRAWLSDREMFEKMIGLYEEHSSQTEEPLFMFGVTVQNHGGYDYSGDDFETTVHLEGYSREYPDVEQYLTCIHATDQAMEWLIEYFEQVDRDVVVVFYGDHYPRLDEDFFEEVHGGEFETLDERMLQYEVPFFVWTNYDSEEGEVALTSLNYLANLMYRKAGIALPAYNQYLEELRAEIPAMNSQGFFSRSANCFLALEEASGDELEALTMYHYAEYNCLFDGENRNEVFFPPSLEDVQFDEKS